MFVLTIQGIRQQSPLLKELESQGAIKIAGGMYNLATAKIDFMVADAEHSPEKQH